MPNATVRANGPALPEPPPDTELLALMKRVEIAAKRYEETGVALEAAEQRRQDIAVPDDLLRTARDHELGLFVGRGFGGVYSPEEISAIRVLCRRMGRENACAIGLAGETYGRCGKILEAWTSWRRNTEIDAAASGYATALQADCDAGRAHDDLAVRLIQIRVSTTEEVLAKARALRSFMVDDGAQADHIREQIDSLGPDNYVVGLSLARDLLGFAEQKEGEAHV